MGKMMKKFTKREERIKRKAKKRAEVLQETLENLGYDLESLIDGTAKVSERAQFAGTLDISEQEEND
jgi:predicted ATPase